MVEQFCTIGEFIFSLDYKKKVILLILIFKVLLKLLQVSENPDCFRNNATYRQGRQKEIQSCINILFPRKAEDQILL